MKLNPNLIELETKENFYDKQEIPFLKIKVLVSQSQK